MARNLSEVLSRPPQEHYARQFVSTIPKDSGTPPEYLAIAANAYAQAQARKVEDLRVSTKVVDLAEKARAVGIDPDPHLLKGAEDAQEAGRNKVIASGPTEHVVVTLDQLIQQRKLQEELAKARKRPSGIKRA